MKTEVDLHQLVEAVGDAVIVSDPAGRITLWNPAAERMFGYSEGEARGASLDLIIPEKLRARHWEGYEKTMQSGQSRYATDLLRVPAIDKAGRRLSIAFTVALLRSATKVGDDTAGDVTGIVAVIRDETQRFEEERGLKKRLAELEAKNKVDLRENPDGSS